jgi:hypothetical protein
MKILLIFLLSYLYFPLYSQDFNHFEIDDNNISVNRYTKLQSFDKFIIINKSISPGDSVFINLSSEINNIDKILSVSSNYYKNFDPRFIKDFELGSSKIIGTSFYYFLNTNFVVDSLYLIIEVLKIDATVSKIELILPVIFKDFIECHFYGNYICNELFHNFKFTTSLDFYKPWQSCVNAGIQQWYGSSSDLYGRNIYYKPASNSHPYSHTTLIAHYYKQIIYDYRNNQYKNHIYYNPETFDGDIKNIAYIGAQVGLNAGREPRKLKFELRGESIYQNLIKPLIPSKKYILEFQVLINTHDLSETRYNGIDDIDVFTLSYLADYDPCSFTEFREILFNPDDKFLIDTTLLEHDKWIHVKSDLFSPDKPMTWFWLGYGREEGALDISYRYGMFFDDVIIREAGAGINSSVSTYYPCMGDTLEYKFKIWKDDPDDKSDISVHNLLPKEFAYVSGDFQMDSNGILKTTIPGSQFDERGIAWLSIRVYVPPNDTLHGKELTNEIYFPDMPVAHRPSVGKYKISVYPGREIIDIKHSAKYKNKCKGDTIEIIVNITNTSSEAIDDLKVRLYDSEILTKIYKQVQIFDSSLNRWTDVIRPELYYNDKIVNRFGYLEGQYISDENDDIILYSIRVKPYSSVILRYYGVLAHDDGDLIVKTSAHPQHQSCISEKIDIIELNKYSFTRRFFPTDTISCSQIVLESPYPEYENHWSDGSIGNSITINKSGDYTLTVIDNFGCTESHMVHVHLEPEFEVYTRATSRNHPFIFKGDTVDLVVKLRYTDAITYRKKVEFIFEFDEELLTLLNKAWTINKIDSSGSKAIYRYSGIWTKPTGFNKDVEIRLSFIVHNVKHPEPEIWVKDVRIDSCMYLAMSELQIYLSNPNVVKIGLPNNNSNSLEVLPSPFNDKLTVRMQIIERNDVSLQINDLIGRVSERVEFPRLGKGIFEYEFNTESYSNGFYNICMFVAGEIICTKLVKIDN